MSNLIVVAYPDEYRAAEVLASLRRLNKEYLIDLDDACYVTKDARGKIKLHQNTSLTGAGAAWGGMWGCSSGCSSSYPSLGWPSVRALGRSQASLPTMALTTSSPSKLPKPCSQIPRPSSCWCADPHLIR